MYKNLIHTETFRDYTNTKLIKIHSIVLEIKHVGRWKKFSHKAETIVFCNMAERYRTVFHPEHLNKKTAFLQNVHILLPGYIAFHSKRQKSSYSPL